MSVIHGTELTIANIGGLGPTTAGGVTGNGLIPQIRYFDFVSIGGPVHLHAYTNSIGGNGAGVSLWSGHDHSAGYDLVGTSANGFNNVGDAYTEIAAWQSLFLDTFNIDLGTSFYIVYSVDAYASSQASFTFTQQPPVNQYHQLRVVKPDFSGYEPAGAEITAALVNAGLVAAP